MPRATPLSRRLFSSLLLRNWMALSIAGRGLGVIGSLSPANAAETEENGKAPIQTGSTAMKSKRLSDETDYLKITEAEWKKRLTAAQFQVARKHGTERAYSGKYYNYKKDGGYRCVCCKAVIFDSEHKFDSGTGWPSFWQPIEEDLVAESPDDSLGFPRTEVYCKRCHAHLGHVFQDAPKTPTGLRYCINSVCLIFVPRKEVE